MKTKIATVIDCNPKTCGRCKFKRHQICFNFIDRLGYRIELKTKPGGATLRCQACLDAEIK